LHLRHSMQFPGGEDGRILGETQFGKILALEVERNSVLDVRRQFIKRKGLRDDRQVQALGDKLPLTAENPNLNRTLHVDSPRA
jgi:hypothetical protein